MYKTRVNHRLAPTSHKEYQYQKRTSICADRGHIEVFAGETRAIQKWREGTVITKRGKYHTASKFFVTLSLHASG
ncbi:hypothetical protein GYMLUDRAFT_938482 [Collybiopsis luxurians FD-317 M1]|uniref:Uncharacterized protein n=1 Tax=Collybiopsis luxurians FD-317 M1 TaxID=944289 RepID=A0A0D0CEG4_9AGAR|nr:hypothetical protein GYMLUDRAFT_938482 [Collybiopsis luxurians FD-317 M1]